jgi:CubicO group peptidase (beta-lactamase class C family)
MESGVNSAAVDYARFGLLFLHGGRRNGTTVVPSDWARVATTAHIATTGSAAYGYFWWVDRKRPGRYYALGNLGQYIYVAPDANAVLVRLGWGRGIDNLDWLATLRAAADRMT